MKLVKIYDVVKDETFVVELLDRQRNVFALKSVVQDRAMLSQPFRLVFNHRQLTRGKVPRACFREGQKPIHLLPDLVRPTSRITVFVKVEKSDSAKEIEIKGLRYSTTVRELKAKVVSLSELSRPELQFNAYYGVNQKSHLQAFELQLQDSHTKFIRRLFRHRKKRIKGKKVHWTDGNHNEGPPKDREDENATDAKAVHNRSSNVEGNPINSSTSGAIMDALELDHYRYLLSKTVTLIRRGKKPEEEIIQYLFERWNAHILAAGDSVRTHILEHNLNLPSAEFFFEIRPELMKPQNSSSTTLHVLCILWITQEILKRLPPKPPWNTRARYYYWKDGNALMTETTENTALLLHHSRLITSHQQMDTPKVNKAKEKGGPSVTAPPEQEPPSNENKPKIAARLIGMLRKKTSTTTT